MSGFCHVQTRSAALTVKTSVNDDTLRRFLGYRLKRAYSSLRADLLARLEPLGLRITTYSALVLIVDNPGLRQSELASALDIKRSNIVAILDDLDARGWGVRQRDPLDRRVFTLSATASGLKVCRRALAMDTKHESRLLACLSSRETERLSALLEKIELSAEEQ